MLGGNGTLLDFQVIRHMANIKAVHTFEGTETMQTLIVGRDITVSVHSPEARTPPGLRSLEGRPAP